MKKLLYYILLALFAAPVFQSCLNGDDDGLDPNVKAWRDANKQYFDEQAALTENGESYYQTLSPSWQPASSILMRWHKRGQSNLGISPMLNSTVDIIYAGYDKDDKCFDNSFSLRENGDSIYHIMPSKLIPGFSFALFQMQVGDSCTVIIPYELGYGNIVHGNIPAYSTLRFGIKLVDIASYEVPETSK